MKGRERERETENKCISMREREGETDGKEMVNERDEREKKTRARGRKGGWKLSTTNSRRRIERETITNFVRSRVVSLLRVEFNSVEIRESSIPIISKEEECQKVR